MKGFFDSSGNVISIGEFDDTDNQYTTTGRYAQSQIVYNTSDSKFYRNKTGTNTTTNPSSDTVNWEVLDLGGEANTNSNAATPGTGEAGLVNTKSGVDTPIKILKAGTNITLTQNANDVTIASSGGGSGTTYTFEDEGTAIPSQTNVTKLNFTGVGVTAALDNGDDTTLDITIPGGGSSIRNIVYLQSFSNNLNSDGSQSVLTFNPGGFRIIDSGYSLDINDQHITINNDGIYKLSWSGETRIASTTLTRVIINLELSVDGGTSFVSFGDVEIDTSNLSGSDTVFAYNSASRFLLRTFTAGTQIRINMQGINSTGPASFNRVTFIIEPI